MPPSSARPIRHPRLRSSRLVAGLAINFAGVALIFSQFAVPALLGAG